MQELIIDEEFKNLIPSLTPEEFNQLEQNCIIEGIRDDIIIWDGIIIDGHNRYAIACKHDLEYETRVANFDNRDDVKKWIILNQFGRRNLSPYNRSLLALKLEDYYKEKAKEKQIKSGGAVVQKSAEPPINTRKELSKVAGVSHDTIDRVRKIEAKATPEIKDKLKAGTLSINEAFNDIKREEKREEVIKKNEEIIKQEVIKPTGKYDVIVIDPAWQMKKIERDVAPEQVEFDYPTMTNEEILKLKIPASDNCHIFLWTTQKYLPFAFECLKEWNVNYIFTIVWHKNGGFQPFGLPQYNCEFCLYGRIGTPQFIDFKQFNTCFNADRKKHSEKPQFFYDLLNRVTGGRKLDMFNRRKIEGFNTFGNESK